MNPTDLLRFLSKPAKYVLLDLIMGCCMGLWLLVLGDVVIAE